jgi:succinyl-diaminopimelate desuccinylase
VIDVERLWRWFETFVAADTLVHAGENRVDPLDPRLAAFASGVAAPAFAELGAAVEIDRLNNVVASFAPRTGDELLLVAYPALHHGNEMADPLRARRVETARGELWVGLGASQSKGGLAAMCAAAAALDDRSGLLLAVCSEGSSTHDSSRVLYETLGEPKPVGAVLTVGTRNAVSIGNRGRVDVHVEIHGEPAHSSVALDLGRNPIPDVAEVLGRVAALELDPAEHPLLGRRSVLPYKLTSGPIAPHTTPAWCRIVFDRRLLPGDDPADAVREIRAVLDGLDVTVTQGATMLPALVDESARVVRSLLAAGARGTFVPRSTFDAGYPCSLGIPTVMCGPLSGELDTTGVLGDDVVSREQLIEAAQVYARAVRST